MTKDISIQKRMKAINKWREQYNPLRGLTISRAVSLLEAAQRGEFADVQWACYFVEQTDPDLLALIERRTGALLEMEYDIRVAESTETRKIDDKLAADQAAALRAAYDKLDNLYEAIEHLDMALFRGFAHVQKWPGPDGAITHLEPLDQWNFVRDGMYGNWFFNPEARSVGASGMKPEDLIDPAGYLIRVCRRPVNRIGLLKFIRQNLSQKDWDAFIEIFGVPGGVVIGPANVPEEKEAAYKDAAEAVAEGASGYLPNGADIKWPDAVRGVSPFQQHLEFLQKQLILAGTGGLLTMLAEAGSGTLAGGAHSVTFQTIARADARKVSEIFQTQFDKPLLAALFPDEPVLAYFEIAAREEQDVGDIVEHALKLSQAGYQMDAAELSTKTGYALSLKTISTPGTSPAFPASIRGNSRSSARLTPVLLNRFTTPAGSSPALLSAALEQLARAEAADLRPLRDRLEIILTIEDDAALKTALDKFQRELPAYLLDINKSPAAAIVLENSFGAALLNGYLSAAQRRRVA